MAQAGVELSTIPSVVPPALLKPESSKSSLQYDGLNPPTEDVARILSENSPHHEDDVSRLRMVMVIATVAGMTLVNSLLTGLLTVGLPSIAQDVKLEDSLLLWYVVLRSWHREHHRIMMVAARVYEF